MTTTRDPEPAVPPALHHPLPVATGQTQSRRPPAPTAPRLLVALAAGLWVGACSSSTQAEWPMYSHDPQHTNTNLDEKAINASSLSSLAPAWQVNIGFQGFGSNSSPTVSGGVVYVGSSVTQGPNFFAFDVATGQPVWSTFLGYASDPQCGPEVVGIPSTAAVSGNALVVGGGDAAYYGLDTRTGKVLWRNAMDDGPSGYAWSSPFIQGGLVYFGLASECDNPSVRGELRAVNVATGAQVMNQYFTHPGGHGGGVWNSPALSPDGQTVVVVTGEDDHQDNGPYEQSFVTLNAASLAILQADMEGLVEENLDLDFGTSPVLFHDHTGRPMGMAGSKDGNFYAYYLDDVASGPVWTRGTTGVSVGCTPAYDPSLGPAGTLFVAGVTAFTQQTQIHALDPETGQRVWPGATPVASAQNNIAVAGRLVFVNTGTTGLVILDETTGAVLKTIVPPNAGPAVSGVTVAEGTVFWVSGGYLNAWRPTKPAS